MVPVTSVSTAPVAISIRTMLNHATTELFFDDLEVPVENLVGKENEGWTYAKYLLTYERTNIAGVGASMAAFERLLEITGGDVEFLDELVDTYLEDAETQLAVGNLPDYHAADRLYQAIIAERRSPPMTPRPRRSPERTTARS